MRLAVKAAGTTGQDKPEVVRVPTFVRIVLQDFVFRNVEEQLLAVLSGIEVDEAVVVFDRIDRRLHRDCILFWGSEQLISRKQEERD